MITVRDAADLAAIRSFGPGGVGDDDALLGWMGDALASREANDPDNRRRFLSTLGMVLFRSGRYREAIDRLREGISATGGELQFPEAVFLAMAYDRVGESVQARSLLEPLRGRERDGSEYDLWALAQWAVCDVILREAERLILGGALPSNPFAP
jgi:hypothetical protein